MKIINNFLAPQLFGTTCRRTFFNHLSMPISTTTTIQQQQSSSLFRGALLSASLHCQMRHKRSSFYIKTMKNWKPPKKLKTKVMPNYLLIFVQSAVKKRFRLTGTGTLRRRMAGKRHHSWAKNRKKVNQLTKWVPIRGQFKKNIVKTMQGTHNKHKQ